MAESGGGGVLRELLAVFSFGVDTKELKHGENKLEEFGKSVKNIATAIAGAFAVKEIYEFVEGSVQAMTAIERTAAQLGISTDKVQEFQFAAKSLGLSAEELTNLMGKLQVAESAAGTGSKEAAKVFQSFGVSIKDVNGHAKSVDELMLDVADGISKVKDPAKQAQIATQLFGRSGRTLLPILKEGKEGFEKYSAAYKELGGGYSREAIAKAKLFEEQSARLSLTLTGLRNVIAQKLIPATSKVVEFGVKMVSGFTKLTKNSNLLQAILGLLAVAAIRFAIGMAIANAPIILITAGIAALALVVDDIITAFKGGNSVIATFIDNVFGAGSSTALIKELKEEWHNVGDSIQYVWDKLKQLTAWYEESVEKGLLGKIGEIASGAIRIDSSGVSYVSGRQLANEQTDSQYNSSKSRQRRGGFSANGIFGGAKISDSYVPSDGTYGPVNNPAASSNATVSVTIVAPPGADAEHYARAARKEMNEALHQAKNTTQRGTAYSNGAK